MRTYLEHHYATRSSTRVKALLFSFLSIGWLVVPISWVSLAQGIDPAPLPSKDSHGPKREEKLCIIDSTGRQDCSYSRAGDKGKAEEISTTATSVTSEQLTSSSLLDMLNSNGVGNDADRTAINLGSVLGAVVQNIASTVKKTASEKDKDASMVLGAVVQNIVSTVKKAGEQDTGGDAGSSVLSAMIQKVASTVKEAVEKDKDAAQKDPLLGLIQAFLDPETDPEKSAQLGVKPGGLEQGEPQPPQDPFEKLHDNPHSDLDFLTKVAGLLSNFNETDNFLKDLLAVITPGEESDTSGLELANLFQNATHAVLASLTKQFGDIGLQFFHPLQFYYYMLQEEKQKDAVWRRSLHRYMPPLPLEEAIEMADGLFLSQLSYLDNCHTIRRHLRKVHNNSWVLRNCTTEGKLFQPAHLMLVRRHSEAVNETRSQQQHQDADALEVVLVVRGSKDLADFLSAAALETAEYRGGKVHSGVLRSARWLHNTYSNDLRQLLHDSGRSHLKLYLMGHSLGGGAAAVASMEFNHHPDEEGRSIRAYAVGFGTPAILSAELSAGEKDRITTVINDADCIPRLSGATLVNVWLKILSYNFTEPALQDLKQLAPVIRQKMTRLGDWTEPLIQNMLEKLEHRVRRDVTKQLRRRKTVSRGPATPELFPPGDCVHLYRDGTGRRAAYMPCQELNEVDVVRNLVKDHHITSGYYPGLLEYIRGLTNDPNWTFDPNFMELPIRK